MSWMSKYKGKYVAIDPKKPSGLGVCDYSGFVFNHKDLVKQMEWRGNKLIWIGFMVGRPYLDKPQEQNRPPIFKPDPKPLKNARPDIKSADAPPNNQRLAQLNQYRWN
jgi:hypothetical protein